MKILKIFFITSYLIFLSGCFQTTSLIGPGVTVATSGNVIQAGFQYGANTALENETGKDVLTHVKDVVDEQNKEKKFHYLFCINCCTYFLFKIKHKGLIHEETYRCQI